MKIKSALIIFVLSSSIFASGGPLYTRYGIGDIIFSQSAREFGMAETGIAFSQTDHLGIINPASWHSVELTRFSSGISFNGYDISNKSASVFYSQTEVSGLSIAVPISNDYGITFAGGLAPYSNVNYDVLLEGDDDILGESTSEYTGDGGLSKAYFGISYKLPFDLAVGATFDYYNGKRDYTSKISFSEFTDVENTEYQTSLKSHGLGYTIGLISPDLASVFGLTKISNLRLGLTLNAVSSLSVDSVSSYRNSKGYVEFQNKNYDSEIPAKLGLGLSMTLYENYTLLFDFVNQNFSEYTVGGVKSAYLRDLRRYSLGFEYRHNSGRFGSTWEQIIWRAGLSYQESQYKVNGKGIDELAAYAGFSFPMGVDNSIDFGFKYGIRGTTDNNLVKENIFSAIITINFGDLWFIRPER